MMMMMQIMVVRVCLGLDSIIFRINNDRLFATESRFEFYLVRCTIPVCRVVLGKIVT